MIEQPYNYQLRVEGDVGWDKKKFLDPNLHVYDEDDTEIMVYNVRRSPRKEDQKKKKLEKD